MQAGGQVYAIAQSARHSASYFFANYITSLWCVFLYDCIGLVCNLAISAYSDHAWHDQLNSAREDRKLADPA
jgi:hypothetical protein